MAPPSKRMSEMIRPYLEDVKHITDHDADPSQIHIENFIGYTRVPVGVAGPLDIRTPHGETQSICAPMATTEAALVASCSRGCKALNASGGVEYIVGRERMSRGPAFQCASPHHAHEFIQILASVQNTLSEMAESTSNHLKLVSLTPHLIGCYAHVMFYYTCGDAAGQNMVTLATQRCCAWLMETYAAQYRIQRVSLEGQMASEKKPSWGNVQTPRGVEVTAWARLSDAACRDVLGCSSALLCDTLEMGQDACIRNGSHGNNIDVANVVTAIFIATGQDVACAVDSSWSHLSMIYDQNTKDLIVSLYFPTLTVGVHGGGTSYETQREGLQIMQCSGPGSKGRLAGFIASFALGLELSTVAAFSNNTFARAHETLRKGESAKL